MRLIQFIKKTLKKLIENLKPKQEFTYEDFKNLERKKGRPSEREIHQCNYGHGVPHDSRYRFW